jgi:hypothetical protein
VRTRIHESDRNRPADAPAPAAAADPETEAMREMGRALIGQLVTTGMAPADVAAQVVDAVREERFYILTHDEWTPLIRERMEGILEGRAPALSLPPGLDAFGEATGA